MNTPICDFVRHYAESNTVRLHMPGHKGKSILGSESLDITEIDGADSLYEASGIIAESERNASALFGSDTYYSTEGSSLCIRAMLYLTCLHARENGQKPLIWAGRNAHKVFLSAATLLDFEIEWLYPNSGDTYLCCKICPSELEQRLANAKQLPTAIYITSPDYLGNIADIATLSSICHRFGVLLLVDNAHGAYLRFLPTSQHPLDLGADACCDSAHKTLPVLTGGAYLHLSKRLPPLWTMGAKQALSMFASTSPSYLILQSLDMANARLEAEYPTALAQRIRSIDARKTELVSHGYQFIGNEALKWTICTKEYGYLGTQLAERLRANGIVCEFADNDFLVLMFSIDTAEGDLERLQAALLAIPRQEAEFPAPPVCHPAKRVLSPRNASLCPFEQIPVENALGRVLASATVSCPPAVPIVVSGEQIDQWAIQAFQYYGIKNCLVVKAF